MVRQHADSGQELLTDEVEISLNWIEYQEHQEDTFEHNEPIRVNCYYCQERFLSVEKCFLHEKTCTKGSTWRYPCQECKINFRMKRAMERHQGRHEEPGGFWCMICVARFTSLADRVQHRNAEHRIYSCQICDTKFRRQSDYVEHIVRFHRAKDEDFDLGTTHGVKVEEEVEENEIPFIQMLQVSQELEDLKSEKEIEEPPDVDGYFGRDSQDKSRKLKRKLSPEKILFQSVEESANLDDDLNGSQRKSQRLMSKRSVPGRVRSLSCADPLKVDLSDENSDDFDYFESLGVCNSPFYESNPNTTNQEEDISAPEEKLDGKPKKYFCKYCDRQFNFQQTLHKHMKLHGPDGKMKVKCSKCNQLFENRVDLSEHWIIHRDERLPCIYCDKTYLTELSLQCHLKAHHKKSIAKTSRDYKQLKSSKSIIKRKDQLMRKAKTKDKPASEDSDSEDPEEKLGEKVKKFACKFCNRQFNHYQGLHNHQSRHGPDGKLRVKCTKCRKLFADRVELAEHWVSHRGERWPCRYCKRSYLTEPNLQNHIKINHKDVKDLKKKDLIAKTSGDLEQSIDEEDEFLVKKEPGTNSKMESIEDYDSNLDTKNREEILVASEDLLENTPKQHICKYCGQRFSFNQCLYRHMKHHGPDGKWKVRCSKCSKLFADRLELGEHFKIHRDERLSCSYCDKTYLTELSLQTHVKINHKDVKDLKKKGLTAKTSADREQSIDEEDEVLVKDQTKEEPGTNSKIESIEDYDSNLDTENREEILVAPEELLENIPKQNICKFCGKQFSFPQCLRRHMKHHGPDGKWKVRCSKCSKFFSEKVELHEHLKIHRDERLSCSYCDKTYHTEVGLQYHLKAHHKKTLKKKGFTTKISRDHKKSKKGKDLSVKKAKTKEKPITDFKTEEIAEDSDNFDSVDVHESLFDESSVESSNDRNSSTTAKEEIPALNLKFDCNLCPMSFSYVKSYSNHMKSQHGIKKLNNSEEMEKKILSKRGTKKKWPSCKICNEQFSGYHELKKHRERHGSDGKLRVHCTMCQELFESKEELVEHKKIHREDRVTCRFCEKTYFGNINLKSHIKKYHKKEHEMMMEEKSRKAKEKVENESDEDLLGTSKQFICKLCKRQFTCYQMLWVHMKLHGPDGALRVNCRLCNQYFADKDLRKEHMEEVHRNTRVICAYCEKSYNMKHNLLTHIRIYHMKTKKKESKRTYLCGKCGRSFTSKTTLTDHEKSDCGKSPIYQCNVCKKFYRSAGSLKTHKLMHTNVFPHLCKYCGKGFRTKAHMQRHERVHTGEKPYKCTYCSMAFSHDANLTNHLSIHTGFKRYMCTGCGQRFSCISGLQSHRKAKADTCGLVPNCTKALGPAQKPPLEI